jgi:hypothetical protein
MPGEYEYPFGTHTLGEQDIQGLVADDIGLLQIDMMFKTCLVDQQSIGLPALTGIVRVMRTVKEIIHAECFLNIGIARVDKLFTNQPPGNTRLVGNADQLEARLFQSLKAVQRVIV